MAGTTLALQVCCFCCCMARWGLQWPELRAGLRLGQPFLLPQMHWTGNNSFQLCTEQSKVTEQSSLKPDWPLLPQSRSQSVVLVRQLFVLETKHSMFP